jgi:hypothetical protein
MKPIIFPFIISCLTYGDTFSGNVHHTPFVFNLYRIKSDIATRAPTGVFVDEGRVPASNLQLVRSPLGNGRAD